VTILGVPSLGVADVSLPPSEGATPGVANQRIEGRLKVTGQKIFARDFNARDMGWDASQWYAMYLAALTTDHAFLGLDLSSLPPEAQPTRVILGNQVSAAQRSTKLMRKRDLNVEAMAIEAAVRTRTAVDASGNFISPLEHDLIVVPHTTPSFLGQAVALLMFDSVSRYRAARRFMQFRDAEFQRYSPDETSNSSLNKPYSPPSNYVKYFEGGASFSYATIDSDDYNKEIPDYRDKIAKFLGSDQFVTQSITVTTQAMDPMFIEPESGLAYYEGSCKTLHVLVGTQSPDGDVANICKMYSSADCPCDIDNIVLTSCWPGGGFGGRDSSPFSLLLALTAAFSDNHPVKLAHDRFEQFRYGLKRPGAKISGKLVVDSRLMKIQGVVADLEFNGGGLKNLSPYVANLAALCIGGAYDIPTADIHAQSNYTRDIPGGSQRGFGGPEAFFAIETAFDDIIAQKRWDPIEARRANLATPQTRTVVGGPIGQVLRLEEMLDITAVHPLWRDRAAIKAEYAANGLTYGTGLAMSLQAYGTSGDGMVAAVFLDSDGAVRVETDAVDMGNGSATTLAVVVGPILGANASAIEMGGYRLFAATGLQDDYRSLKRWEDPTWTQSAVGSSSACLTGLHQVHVVQQTARALLVGVIAPAAQKIWGRPDINADDLVWTNGDLADRSSVSRTIPRQTLANFIHEAGLPRGALGHAYFQSTWVEADFPTPAGEIRLQLDGLSFYLPNIALPVRAARKNTMAPTPETKLYSRYVWSPCVNVVGLTVDKTNGQTRVENVLSVLNAGKIIVPQLVSGQSQGGVAMAIGYALMEDMPDGMAGPANGDWNLDRYHVPRLRDVPVRATYQRGDRAQELIVLPETVSDQGSGRGIAEAVMCSVAPAISNALFDAVGKRLTALPISPKKILEGLRS